MERHLEQQHGTNAWDVVRRQPPRLRLVDAGRLASAPRSKPAWTESSIACPSRLRLVGRTRRSGECLRHDDDNDYDKRRRFDRHEGTTMEKMEGFIYGMSRFVFGLGIGLALTSAWVIVSSAPDLLGPGPIAYTAARADIVRLDPVVVSISAERFAAIEAESMPQVATTVHVYGSGPTKV